MLSFAGMIRRAFMCLICRKKDCKMRYHYPTYVTYDCVRYSHASCRK